MMERSDLHDYNVAVRSGRMSHDAGLPVVEDGGDTNGSNSAGTPNRSQGGK